MSPQEARQSHRQAAFAQIEFATDSPLEGTGFELLVRGRAKLVVGRRRQRNQTARPSRCRWASVSFDQLVPRTRARRARTSLCSTVGQRNAPRTPFHRSRDRARYRYYEGSRSGPAVTACQHYCENCSFSRDVMRQSSPAAEVERREILLEGLIDMGSCALHDRLEPAEPHRDQLPNTGLSIRPFVDHREPLCLVRA